MLSYPVVLCPECGAKNVPTVDECVSCGALLPESSDGPDPLIGRIIADKYELLEIIGEGSMGSVYGARQTDLDREVAVKVLHTHVAADPKVAKRFHREARTASRLSHPNSLQIFDFGREEEGPLLYIIMELLDGPDLLELMEDEFPLSPRRIADLVGGVLLALEEAHDLGVIHRDLKPENIMVVEDHQGREHVKVCDFGIAKLVEAEGSAITVTGFVCGTPEYMAPEQARGEPLDSRADLYAIGCLLYYLMTRSVPFSGGSALGTITKHLTEAVEPPGQRKPELYIPRSMERVCMKALSKDPDRRYRSAGEMRQALEEAVAALGELADDPLGTHEEDPTREAPPPPEPSRAWMAPVLVAIGVILIGIVVVVSDSDPISSVDAGVLDSGAGTGADALAGAADSGAGADSGTADAEPDGVVAAEPDARPPASMMTLMGMQSMQSMQSMDTETMDELEAPWRTAFDEGRRRFLANDIPGAIEAFETSRQLSPRNPQVHKQLGRAYMRSGDVAGAASSYERYLELAPNASDRSLVEQILQRLR